MKTIEDVVVVQRTYRHPRDLVFRAWTEPRRLNAWFKPFKEMQVETTVDLRVGGQFQFKMTRPDGDSYVGGGVYTRILRPELLGFTWFWEVEEVQKDESHVTVEFHEVPDGTEIVLKHEGLSSAESMEKHAHGWIGCLDQLQEHLLEAPFAMPAGPTDLVGAAGSIEHSRIGAERALSRIKDTFDHVPDDKLNWKPSETSKSSLRIFVHACGSNAYFASVLRGAPSVEGGRAAVLEAEEALARSITTREQANRLYETSSREALEAIANLTPSQVQADETVAFILTLIGRHTDSHASQIDLLQTCWNDQEDHFGM